jgi:ribose transport system substrate-binding protein
MRLPSGWPGPNTPVKPPAKPITLGILPCGPYGGCVLNGEGMTQAAKALGWKSISITPTTGTPQEVNADIIKLIDDGANAITWVGFPRAVLKPALAAAAAKHIPMVSYRADDIPVDSSLDVPIGTVSHPEEILGEQAAWWIILNSGAKANIVMETDNEFTTGQLVDKGFEQVLAMCPGCHILAQKDITAASESTVAAGETVTLLGRYPQTNYVFAPFDSRAPYMVQGVREAQRENNVTVVSSDTDSSQKLLTEGKPVYVSNSLPEIWGGWATVDQLLRLMAHQPLVPHPLPVLWRTAANANAPFFVPEGKVNVINYPAEFKRLWGVK